MNYTSIEKVEAYIQEAWNILNRSHIAANNDLGKSSCIEIAKMLQAEEHFIVKQNSSLENAIHEHNRSL